MRLDNKVALVTGAAQGIGLACAEEFAKHGAKVVLSDVQEEKCRAEAERIASETGMDTLAVACDVANEADVAALFDAAKDRFGTLDITVPNAGIIRQGSVLDLSAEDFDRVLSVNLRGTFLVSQAAAKLMVATGTKGSIINMSSTNSVVAIPNQLAYVTSKGGVAQLTKAMALSLVDYGIRVNAIGPGSIMTDVLKTVMHDDDARRMILSRTPMKRVGDPKEIATIAVFLASEYASYITGETIFADGGRLALNYVVPVDD